MKITLIFLFFISIPLTSVSQNWKVYSDSVLTSYKEGKIYRANHFIKLADEDLKISNSIKDTTYADYLYRKGITLIENNSSKLVKNYKANEVRTVDLNVGRCVHQASRQRRRRMPNHFLNLSLELKKCFSWK